MILQVFETRIFFIYKVGLRFTLSKIGMYYLSDRYKNHYTKLDQHSSIY